MRLAGVCEASSELEVRGFTIEQEEPSLCSFHGICVDSALPRCPPEPAEPPEWLPPPPKYFGFPTMRRNAFSVSEHVAHPSRIAWLSKKSDAVPAWTWFRLNTAASSHSFRLKQKIVGKIESDFHDKLTNTGRWVGGKSACIADRMVEKTTRGNPLNCEVFSE